ncbi:MAG: sigma-70 family RNA polymerase sigma factor, partial [Candidatus Gastranaerophilales bacterium]|nr:sigma-70 family RNA polymerase sigma factor [Candidatus Gastranaerophilales bacterium]
MKNLRKIEADFYNENDLIKRAQSGDVWARNQVIENNMSLVKKIAAKSIQKSALSDSDLIQEGIFGLVTAIEKFDLTLGYKFSTYATWWVKQAMFKAISEQSYALNIPVYIQETLSRYNKTKQEMEQKENKEVSKKEVAK